ncbi:MAG: AbrB family transcriptional regulator [Paracoccaceae bacterium]
MQLCELLHPWRIATLALAAVGAGLFYVLNLPLPLLLGPMFACLVAALLGAPMRGTPKISEAMRPVLGVAVGASLTPALIDRLDEMALSVALIPFFVIAIGASGYPYFRKLWGFDHATSYYAAMPGGLQDMVIFGEEAGANVRALSLIHTTRVLVIVSLMPFLLTWIWGLELTGAPGDPASSVPPVEYIMMLVAAILGWWGGVRAGLFGAPIIGPLIVAGILSLTDLLHSRPPAEVMYVAQFFLGLGIGVKYAGITVVEIKRILSASLGYCVILAVLSVIFAEFVIQTGLADPLQAIMAFAPGGQAEMVLLAIIAGADMAFVVTHHMVRVILVILLAPVFARLLDR